MTSVAKRATASDGRTMTTALENTLKEIEKEFGQGTVLRMSDTPGAVDVIPTGSDALDTALGIGGIPRGLITEVYGPESSGKTTLVQHMIANAQAQGLTAAFIDAEHCLDPDYARAIGIDVDALLFSQPDSGEQALEIAMRLIKSGEVGIIVIDSVAALTPQAELKGEMGDATVGAQARMMGQFMRKAVGELKRSNCALVFTNQLREAIGVMFGPTERQPGGRALKFAAAVRLDIRRIQTVKHGDEAIANKVRVKVVKNKKAPPLRTAEFEISYGVGIDNAAAQFVAGLADGSIEKSGSWYIVNGQRVHGVEAAKAVLRGS